MTKVEQMKTWAVEDVMQKGFAWEEAVTERDDRERYPLRNPWRESGCGEQWDSNRNDDLRYPLIESLMIEFGLSYDEAEEQAKIDAVELVLDDCSIAKWLEGISVLLRLHHNFQFEYFGA